MRYRKPKSLDKFFRPEIQARHTAFQRGSAYLERYCMLIAFSVYLRQCRQRGRRLTFAEWVAARPDVQSARESLHQNPAGALAPLPSVPSLVAAPGVVGREIPVPSTIGKDVPLEEQRKVLMRRRGNTVGRRSILKSFGVDTQYRHAPAVGRQMTPAPGAFLKSVAAEQADNLDVVVDGVSDVRGARGMPVFAVGSATVDGLRRLLGGLGALPNGPTHVVITDLREELVLYVNGTAYTRRELEMPAAALHHAGIQAAKLEDLERRLRADMMTEAASWGGNLLLHREIESAVAQDVQSSTPLQPGSITRGTTKAPSAAQLAPDTDASSCMQRACSAPVPGSGAATGEDITRTTEYQPTTQVTAFWELAGDVGDIDTGMCTPSEVFVGMAAEGYQISYRRVPMSRERTPQAADLDHLHLQMTNHPGGRRVAFLFVSRTATGSSARLATAFACSILCAQEQLNLGTTPLEEQTHEIVTENAPDTSSVLLDKCSSSQTAHSKRHRMPVTGIIRQDSEPELSRSAQAGEYRGIMNLCRVLPGGTEAKQAVDAAIDACEAIGNLREDILRCKQTAEGE